MKTLAIAVFSLMTASALIGCNGMHEDDLDVGTTQTVPNPGYREMGTSGAGNTAPTVDPARDSLNHTGPVEQNGGSGSPSNGQ